MSAEINPDLRVFAEVATALPTAEVLAIVTTALVETTRTEDDLKRLARLVLIELDVDPDEVYGDFLYRPDTEEILGAFSRRMKQLMAATEGNPESP